MEIKKPTFDPATLVSLLAIVAQEDTTEPPGWWLDSTLRSVEKLVLVRGNDPGAFASIAIEALKSGVIVNPANHALLQLAAINGLRRLDTIGLVSLENLFRSVKTEIDALPSGPRQGRCLSFWGCQRRVFSARIGHYAEASAGATAEAETGPDPKSRAISAYLDRVYAMWAALLDNNEKTMEVAFEDLVTALPGLQAGVAGTDAELQWGKGNGPIHLLQAMFLMDLDLNDPRADWAKQLALVQENAAELGDAFAPWIAVLTAHDLTLNNRDAEALQRAEQIIASGAPADVVAAARLIKGDCYVKLSRQDEARIEYVLITPCPNGHMIAAVAQDALAALGQ